MSKQSTRNFFVVGVRRSLRWYLRSTHHRWICMMVNFFVISPKGSTTYKGNTGDLKWILLGILTNSFWLEWKKPHYRSISKYHSCIKIRVSLRVFVVSCRCVGRSINAVKTVCLWWLMNSMDKFVANTFVKPKSKQISKVYYWPSTVRYTRSLNRQG